MNDGAWPSGKAPGFGPGIRGFESLRPSHNFGDESKTRGQSYYFGMRDANGKFSELPRHFTRFIEQSESLRPSQAFEHYERRDPAV